MTVSHEEIVKELRRHICLKRAVHSLRTAGKYMPWVILLLLLIFFTIVNEGYKSTH